MSTGSAPALFSPLKVGTMQLAHRVVLAPMTRMRADEAHVPTDLMVEYYKQRSSVPGSLLITEGVFIAPQAGGIPRVPGIWSEEQVVAWKKVTDAVHKNGSYIHMQLWALGRAARANLLQLDNPEFKVVSASAIALKQYPDNVPHELTKEEIKQYVEWYGTAAANAVRAGFDGVQIHGANGYLVDQFLQDTSNKRTDEYGGSIENRARFALEAVDSVVKAIGPERSAIRLSPWNGYQDMRMEDPIPTFSYLAEQLKAKYPKLAYLDVVGVNAIFQVPPEDLSTSDFIHKIWTPGVTITTGGFERDTALKTAEETGQLIGFGHVYISNPDLPFRLREKLELADKPPMSVVFTPSHGPELYISYPYHPKFLEAYPQFKL